jgi:hypothetical protein
MDSVRALLGLQGTLGGYAGRFAAREPARCAITSTYYWYSVIWYYYDIVLFIYIVYYHIYLYYDPLSLYIFNIDIINIYKL